jgi:hypothetical protein
MGFGIDLVVAHSLDFEPLNDAVFCCKRSLERKEPALPHCNDWQWPKSN